MARSAATRQPHWPRRIVSGGQTGVDRAALEVAIALGIEHGGWCPRGRLAEDGMIPSRYLLTENDSSDYKVRTAQNVAESDATLILHERPLSGGTRLTERVAKRASKPLGCFLVCESSIEPIRDWLDQHLPEVLNVAGPRDSVSPGIEQRAAELLMRVWARCE